MLNILFAFLWAVFLMLFMLPTLMRVALFTNIVDKPKATTHNLHDMPVPLLGGIGTYAAILSGTFLFGGAVHSLQVLLGGGFLLFILGIKDDIMGSSSARRALVQLLTTTMLIVVGDVRITSLYGILGVGELPLFFSYLLTFILVVGLTNAFNLIDGIDGLLGTITLCCSLCLVYFLIDVSGYPVILAALCGAMLPFLRYNVLSPRIFMGDSGALVCGYVLSGAVIVFIEGGTYPTAPALALSIFFYPVFDVMRTACLRVQRLHSPFCADRSHIHHLLQDIGLSKAQTVSCILIVNMGLFAITYAFRHWTNELLFTLICGEALVLHMLLLFLSRRSSPRRSHSIPIRNKTRTIRYFTHVEITGREN